MTKRSPTSRPSIAALVETAKGLAHPARLRLLAMLADGELCVCQMTAVLELAPSTVSQHLAILARGELSDYRLAHAARADMCRRLGRRAEARAAYERALALTRQEPERRFLERRLGELQD